MRSLTLVFVAVVLAYVGYTSASAPEMTCKDFVGSLTKRQLGGISACTKSMKFKNPKEKASKMNCILKCVLKKEGVLNEEGYFDASAFDGFMEKEMPPNLMEKGKAVFGKCVDAAATVDPNEEMCKTYDPLIKCMLDAIGTLCK